MLFVFNVPYDLLSEEVGADGRQPVDTGPVVLSCTRLLHKISHKRPENTTHTVDFTKYYKLNSQKGIKVLFISTHQEDKARQEYDLDRFLTFYTSNFYINTS